MQTWPAISRSLSVLLVLLLAGGAAAQDQISLAPLSRIALGSCANQEIDQPVWQGVLSQSPELFIFLGDNIYADTADMAVKRAAYAQLGAKPGYQKLKATTQIVATWDDHDYGWDEAAGEYPAKAASKQAFLDFFEEPADSKRRLREGGIYTSYFYGPPEQRVQVILLDPRYDRDPFKAVSRAEKAERKKVGMGEYLPNDDPAMRMLGDDQWAWLENQLRRPARLRLIATGQPFVMEFTGREAWANFPRERRRMIDLIADTEAEGIIFMSGDTHWAEFSRLSDDVPYPLWDLTASSLTHPQRIVANNRHRVGSAYPSPNFGLIRVDWQQSDPVITLEVRDTGGFLELEQELRLSELIP